MTTTSDPTTTVAIGRYADGTEATTEIDVRLPQALEETQEAMREALHAAQERQRQAATGGAPTTARTPFDGLALRWGGAVIGVAIALAFGRTVYGGPVPLNLIAGLAATFLTLLGVTGLAAHVRAHIARTQGR